MNKKSISLQELRELVQASVRSGTIRKDYPDYLDACRELGVSSYVLNLLIQKEKEQSKSVSGRNYTDLLFVKEQMEEESNDAHPSPVSLSEMEKPKEKDSFSKAWYLVCLFIILCLVLFAALLDYSNKNERLNGELGHVQARLSNYNGVIRSISKLSDNVQDHIQLGNWRSSNHEEKSVSEKKFNFVGFSGDKLTFNYRVSSESFDSLIVYLYLEGERKPKFRMKESGQISNSRSYVIEKKGNYSLHLKYKKDGSIDKYDDKAEVSNICVYRNTKSVIDSIRALCREIIEEHK